MKCLFTIIFSASVFVGVHCGDAQEKPPTKGGGAEKGIVIGNPPAIPDTGVLSKGNLFPDKPELFESKKAIVAPEKRAPNSFQRFILEHSGVLLPIFGQDLFLAPPSTFAPADDIPVTPDYIVGPGDELVIRAWGQIDINLRVTVDRNGAISIPKVGDVNVVGLKYRELQGFLSGQIGKLFQNFEMNVTMGRLRSIQVLVVGHAQKPGNYTISSLSTLINAIFASGGPSASGTMRKIQLKRDNKLVTELDLYDLLLKGDKDQDARLQSGDVIFIPPIGKLVALAGQINNPAVYELKAESTLTHVVDWAGGMSANAFGEKVVIERIIGRQFRKALEFEFNETGGKEVLHEGDLIIVSEISPRFEKSVVIRGHVSAPSRVPWKEGMRISNLFENPAALIPYDYWVKQNALAKNIGAVTNTLGEVIQRNEVKSLLAPINWEYAAIQRLDPKLLSTSLMPFHLGKAIFEKSPDENHELHQGDVVTIFSQSDIRVPLDKRVQMVTLEGEIARPGVYQIHPKETLRDLIQRVGGFSTNAYLYGAIFTRESTRADQQARMDESLGRLEIELQRSMASSLSEAGSTESALDKAREMEARKLTVEKMRAIRAVGRIAMDFPKDGKILSQFPAITLENGDRFFVPSLRTEIHVMGSVYNQNSHLWRANAKVGDYLVMAGGLMRSADKSFTYIIRADGTVHSKSGGGWFSGSVHSSRLLPGDTVVVPELLDQTNWRRELKDWAQIASQFAIAAAAIKVLSP